MMLAQKQTHKSVKEHREPRYKSCLYGQLIHDKGIKNINGGKTVFSKWCWENGQLQSK